MRPVLPALILAAVTAGPAAAEPFITPGVVAGVVVPALVEAALASGASRAPYAAAPGAYASPSGNYVQYYDPRTGGLVGTPVPVSPYEYARRAARVPADAPVIRVRPSGTVTELGIEHVRRPVLRGAYDPAPMIYRRRPAVYAPRYAAHVYAPGPRYGARVYAPGPRYGARVYAPGPRFRSPHVAYGPYRYRGAPYYAPRHRGLVVVPGRRVGVHGPAFRQPHAVPYGGARRFGPPQHQRMAPPPAHRAGAAYRPGPHGPAPRAGRPPFGGY